MKLASGVLIGVLGFAFADFLNTDLVRRWAAAAELGRNGI